MGVRRWAWSVGSGLLLACSAPKVPLGDPQAEITTMLTRSAADWNAGDLASFMGDYAHDSLTSYVTGGHVQYGWQKLYDRYQAGYFAPGKRRDSLTFDPVKDAVILVKNGHIEAVARVNEIAVPRGAQTISLIGKTVIPGLIDAHAHAERWAAERYVAWGVTTVRDLGAMTTDSAMVLRNDWNLGAELGPRVLTAGGMIDGVPPTYPTATGVASAGAVRKAVDQRAVAGTDLLKIYTKITPLFLKPLMDEASTLRLRVAAHLGKTDAVTAARAGVASLEHMAGVVQAAARNPAPYVNAHDRFLTGWTLEESGWASLDSASVARVARG